MERFYNFEIHVKGVDYPAIISKKKNKKIDDIYDLAIANYIKNNSKKTEKDFLIELKKEVESKQYYDDVIMCLLLAAENLGFLVLNEYEL